jgi:hypothetical protein
VPALRELQRSFAAALFDGAPTAVLAMIEAADPDAADRFDVYRNNVRVGFAKALAIAFPVIERLMGEQYFRQVAEEFRLAHPSRAGDLHHIGAPFPGFLGQRFGETDYAYFPDVAELEWAYQEALIAADEEPIPVEALREVAPAAYEWIRLSLDPAVRLVRSDFPILRIWSVNQPDSADEEIIDLRDGGDHVLVLRTREHVEFHRLPRGEFAVLQAIAAGFPLGTALEAALSVDGDFDPGPALHRFFRLNLFTALATDTPAP